MSIARNLEQIRENISRAATLAGRVSEEITLLAVTKTKPAELVREVAALGLSEFGENYVQEALEKQQSLKDLDLKWHFIGPIQSNKAKLVVGKFNLIHTVDRPKIVSHLNQQAVSAGVVQPVLVQVNVGGEISKSGVSAEEAKPLLANILQCEGLQLRGLMTMPPQTSSESEARGYFARLRKLRDTWVQEFGLSDGLGHQLTELSMGTSLDYHWAIEEGATIIRLGTVLVGAREYKVNN